MERYANRSGKSGVLAFEIAAEWIRVRFSDGSIYSYTNVSAGAANIEHMKQLAREGLGLNSFIVREVREKYAQKTRS